MTGKREVVRATHSRWTQADSILMGVQVNLDHSRLATWLPKMAFVIGLLGFLLRARLRVAFFGDSFLQLGVLKPVVQSERPANLSLQLLEHWARLAVFCIVRLRLPHRIKVFVAPQAKADNRIDIATFEHRAF